MIMQEIIDIIFELCKNYIDNEISGLDLMPIGTVVMWSGEFGNVPEGWLNCNGENGTIDLRQRFVLPAGSGLAPHITGGSSTHGHSIDLTHNHGTIPGVGLAFGTYRWSTTADSLSGTENTDEANHMPSWKSLVFIQKMFYV